MKSEGTERLREIVRLKEDRDGGRERKKRTRVGVVTVYRKQG